MIEWRRVPANPFFPQHWNGFVGALHVFVIENTTTGRNKQQRRFALSRAAGQPLGTFPSLEGAKAGAVRFVHQRAS